MITTTPATTPIVVYSSSSDNIKPADPSGDVDETDALRDRLLQERAHLVGARAAGVDVSAAVSANHFALSEEAIDGYRTFCKLDPPLRAEDDRQAMIEGLADGSIDMICGPFSITAERMERFDYSFLIFASGAGVATRREVSTLLQPSVKAAKERPAQVVVVSETTTEALVQTLLGTAVDIMRMPTHTAAYDALSSGKADFYFGDRVILNAVAARSKLGKDIVVGGKFLTYEPYALPVLRGRNQDLLRAANLAIAALYRDGGIENVYKSHFPDQRPSDLLQALFQLYALPER